MEGNRTYLTLKEASEKLGVHPNTLRNWEQKGLVRLARLPGDRNRRVPVSEIERLEREMARDRPKAESPDQAEARLPNTRSWRVRVEAPNTDPEAIAAGRALARQIQEELARREPKMTLEEVMRSLRGWSWL